MTADAGGSPSPPASPPAGFSPVLTRAILVTTVGSFMAFLDSTIVNVALESLTVELDASLATIQWVITAYLLAMAAVIPVSGWAANRFGARRTYAAGLLLFTVASLACGLADSTGMLIAARAAQGVGGGLLMPVGTMITMRASRPDQMAKVMAVTGVPTIMAPIIGPTIGGLLLDHASWPWIFYINLPIGLITLLLTLRMLEPDQPTDAGPLDVAGVVLITGGSVAITYGLAQIGAEGEAGSPLVIWSIVAGAVLLVGFVLQQLRARKPLMDIRLYKSPVYGAASITNFCLGAAVFGAIILMPLYFQIVRQEDAVSTGLLLIPQGVGVAVAMFAGAKLTDKLGSGKATLLGGAISIVGTVPFTFIDADTSYWFLGAMMVVRGFGVGACAIPAVTAAYRAISPMKIPDATVQINVGQRIGGSAGTAIFAVVLQNQLDGAADPAAQASGFGVAFWWVVAIAVGCTAPALLLTAAERRAARQAAPAGPPAGAPPKADAAESAS
ncbi:MAG TPA: MDR family MFS transporter [Thermomonospora sp.]|nr:MDR family MFS transporter [Thermomonospora sp.]